MHRIIRPFALPVCLLILSSLCRAGVAPPPDLDENPADIADACVQDMIELAAKSQKQMTQRVDRLLEKLQRVPEKYQARVEKWISTAGERMLLRIERRYHWRIHHAFKKCSRKLLAMGEVELVALLEMDKEYFQSQVSEIKQEQLDRLRSELES